MAVSTKDFRKLFHQEKHGNKFFIAFLCLFVSILQNVFHICIIHSLIYTDHSLCNLMGNHISFFVNIHKTA